MENPETNGHSNRIDHEEPPLLPNTVPLTVPVGNILTEYMRNKLAVVAEQEGFVNYTIHDEKGLKIGAGFVGIMFKVHIQEVDSDKKLTVMLKAPPVGPRRNELGALLCFKREVLMYTKVLPAFVDFQKEKKINESQGFFNFPKVYFAEFDEELQDSIIIMGDLEEIDCVMVDKFAPTNFEHSKFVVESLGRLHAISFAMKTQRPEIFDELKQLDDLFNSMTDHEFDKTMDAAMDRAAQGLPENAINARNKIQKMRSVGFKETMKKLVDPENAEPFAVISHGDCWSNNFMYKYRRNRPEGIVFVVWQISRYCSPVLDLLYFIFCFTDSAMRVKHYDELLRIYYKSLKDLLDNLGGDTVTQFPFTAFLRQIKNFGKFGVLMGVFVIPLVTTKTEDFLYMDEIAEKYKQQSHDAMEGFTQKNSENTNSRLNDAIIDATKYGYL